MNFKEYLSEKILTIGLGSSDYEARKEHADEISGILKSSYIPVGGYGGLGSGSEAEHNAIHADIHHPDHFIKASRRNGKIVAVSIYKKTGFGRKTIASGTDGSLHGKKDFLKIKEEDRDQTPRHSYSEVSDKPEAISAKLGVPKVPNTEVGKILSKKITKDADGYHYTRDIGGHPHKKVMVGNPVKGHKFY